MPAEMEQHICADLCDFVTFGLMPNSTLLWVPLPMGGKHEQWDHAVEPYCDAPAGAWVKVFAERWHGTHPAPPWPQVLGPLWNDFHGALLWHMLLGQASGSGTGMRGEVPPCTPSPGASPRRPPGGPPVPDLAPREAAPS